MFAVGGFVGSKFHMRGRLEVTMNKKQKTILYRIIISAVLVVAVSILDAVFDLNIWISAVLYLIPYL